MRNGWTGGQYSLARAALGIYLAVHFAALVPWAGEVFSNQGLLPSGSLSPWTAVFPNALSRFDSPAAVAVALIGGVLLGLMFAAGIWDRPAALGLWYLWACLLGRNPLILNPSMPYLGWLLLAHMFVPEAPFGSWTASLRPVPPGRWRFPQPLFGAAWAILAAGYTYSGWTKVLSPSWSDGSAFRLVLENPLMRQHWLAEGFLSLPDPVLKGITWAALAAELFFAPLACVPALRPWLWGMLFAMHAALIGLIDFADLSLGMAIFHLFTFDPAWIAPRSFTASVFYDGSCALCHRFVRFILSEDRQARLRLSPLGNPLIPASVPPPGSPDSIAVFSHEGKWLFRSSAILYILAAVGGYWRIIASAVSMIPAPLLDFCYDRVAGNRLAVGRTLGPCPLPPARLARRLAGA